MAFPLFLYLPLLPFLWLSQYAEFLPFISVLHILPLSPTVRFLQGKGGSCGNWFSLPPFRSGHVASPLHQNACFWSHRWLGFMVFPCYFSSMSSLWYLLCCPAFSNSALFGFRLSRSTSFLFSPPYLLIFLLGLCFGFPIYLMS